MALILTCWHGTNADMAQMLTCWHGTTNILISIFVAFEIKCTLKTRTIFTQKRMSEYSVNCCIPQGITLCTKSSSCIHMCIYGILRIYMILWPPELLNWGDDMVLIPVPHFHTSTGILQLFGHVSFTGDYWRSTAAGSLFISLKISWKFELVIYLRIILFIKMPAPMF